MSVERGEDSPSPDDNVVLRQLQGIRRELQAVLDNQARDRTLLVRFHDEMGRMRGDLDGVARNLRDVKGDVLLVDNRLLGRHNEILDILRRLDEGAQAVSAE